jgi:deoxyribodipyrimidine photo-lyase
MYRTDRNIIGRSVHQKKEQMSLTPSVRVKTLNPQPLLLDRFFAVYWMNSSRRLKYNYALDLAIGRAEAIGKALLVVEILFCTESWARDRFHRFVFDRMEVREGSIYNYLRMLWGQ